MKFKEVIFVLNPFLTEELHPSETWRVACKEVIDYMESNGFEHRRELLFRSKTPMSKKEVENILFALLDTSEWLEPCVDKLGVGNAGFSFNPLPLLDLSPEEREKELDGMEAEFERIQESYGPDPDGDEYDNTTWPDDDLDDDLMM